MARRRKNEKRDELMREVRRRHRSATSKVSRLRSRGIELGGTDNDVRRDLSRVKNYNVAQLESYLSDLNSFNSRSTGFVEGYNGAALDANMFRRLKDAEAQVNARRLRYQEQIGDTFIPSAGMTIRQRRAMTETAMPTAFGKSANDPLPQTNYRAADITSQNGLEKILNRITGKLSPGHFPKVMKAARVSIRKLTDELGAPELGDKLLSLTNHQLDIAWNWSGLAEALSRPYHSKIIGAANMNGFEDIVEDSLSEAKDLFEWAKTLPRTNKAKS